MYPPAVSPGLAEAVNLRKEPQADSYRRKSLPRIRDSITDRASRAHATSGNRILVCTGIRQQIDELFSDSIDGELACQCRASGAHYCE